MILVAVAGCGGGDTPAGPTPAAIGGPDGGKAATAAARLEAPEARAIHDPLHPVVVIETSKGKITVRLDAEKAPLSVDNFLSYVERRHFDQTIFHQVLADYPSVVLGGGFTAELVEKETLTPVRNEADNGRKNVRGTIAMARQIDAIDSATCQFFINVTDNEMLDHKDRTPDGYGYCVFGEVIEGMEAVDEIVKVPVKDADRFKQIPVETVMINSVSRTR